MKARQSRPGAVEVFRPHPDILYTIDATAQLAGVSRRTLLVYCRSGMIRPVVQPPFGVLYFSEDGIRTIRRLEYLRRVHGINLAGLRIIQDLMRELERVRAELDFQRRSSRF